MLLMSTMTTGSKVCNMPIAGDTPKFWRS